MRRATTLFLATLLVSMSFAVAEAAGPKQTAAALINEGNKFLRSGDYRAALARYTAAHEVYPTPKIFFNMAEAHREIGELVQAATYFERFVAESGVARRSKLRRTARARLRTIKKKIAVLSVRTTAVGASVFVDGERIGTAPIKAHRVMPGAHEIILDKRGYKPRTVTIEVSAGEQRTIDEPLTPLVAQAPPPPAPALIPPPPPPPPEPAIVATAPEPVPTDSEGLTSKWWFWTAVVGVVAVGAGTTVFLASRGADDFMLEGDLGVTSTTQWNKL